MSNRLLCISSFTEERGQQSFFFSVNIYESTKVTVKYIAVNQFYIRFPYLFSFLHCWMVSNVASKNTPEASAVACFSLG